MNTDRSVKVKDIVEKFQMEVLYPGADFETETLTITDGAAVRRLFRLL